LKITYVQQRPEDFSSSFVRQRFFCNEL
jgi:hypothetical protein